MTDKHIPASKMLALQQHNDLNPLYENGGDYVLYDDLRALIDEAPELEKQDDEAVGELSIDYQGFFSYKRLKSLPSGYHKLYTRPAPKTYTEHDIDVAIGAVDWANTSWQQAAVEAKKLVMRFVGSQVTMEVKRLSEDEVELLVGQYGEAHNLNGTNQYVRAIIGDNVDDFANALMDKMTGGGK